MKFLNTPPEDICYLGTEANIPSFFSRLRANYRERNHALHLFCRIVLHIRRPGPTNVSAANSTASFHVISNVRRRPREDFMRRSSYFAFLFPGFYAPFPVNSFGPLKHSTISLHVTRSLLGGRLHSHLHIHRNRRAGTLPRHKPSEIAHVRRSKGANVSASKRKTVGLLSERSQTSSSA